jgi:hypothetical protein
MAMELIVIESSPREMLSLPPQLAWLESGLGTCQWPGENVRTTLMSGVKISDQERSQAEAHLRLIQTALDPHHPDRAMCSMARFSLLTRMMMAYSAGATTDEAAGARLDAYADAVDDMPPWAIGEAIKRWHRGTCANLGFVPNYTWAPAPAHLRMVCKALIAEYETTAAKLNRLLAAVPIAEATRIDEDIERVRAAAESFRSPPKAVGDVKPAGTHAQRIVADLDRRREANAARTGAAADRAHAEHLDQIDEMAGG